MHHGSTSTGIRSQVGFSLTEAMIAIVVLATSMLGIAATSARVGQAMNSAQIRVAAAEQARGQLTALLARPYGELADGSAVAGGVAMEWTVTDTSRAQEITLVYRYDLRGTARADTIVSARMDR